MNAGINTRCKACDASGRECTYPVPAATGYSGNSGRGSNGQAGVGSGIGASDCGEAPKRQRTKKASTSKSSNAYYQESPKALVDALDPYILTPKVWSELFEIFQLHFSTDLPFFHAPTFLKPLRKSISGPTDFSPTSLGSSSSVSQPQASPLLLLGLLSLTARFHPQLSAHHSPPSSNRPTNPSVASEYYASALRTRMGGDAGDSLGQPSLERIQALLMLGLHEWGTCHGTKAWILVGIAVRMAQVMGLEFEHELDNEPLAISSALHAEAIHLGVENAPKGSKGTNASPSEKFIDQEIRRRTFWSCFIMDRYLSSGKYRPQMVNIKDLRIQLPSSERAFLFGERVRTNLLGDEIEEGFGRATLRSQRKSSVLHGGGNAIANHENQDALSRFRESQCAAAGDGIDEEERGSLEIGADEGLLSRFVKIVEIWGRIAKWSCSGGRRTERDPPWDENSTFHSLRKLLAQFHACLPRQLTFSTANISAHITSRTSTPYTLMHTVYFLCLIVLHREYVPFIPIRCSKPQGPLDPPVFDPQKYDIPDGFWDESARGCFKSARDIMDLVRICQDWGVLVETPMVGFAIYTVAFTGIYCINFPQMDPDGYMCDINGSHGGTEARRAVEMIGQMRPRLKMADGWFRTIKKMHGYFVKMKKDYQQNTRALQSSDNDGSSAAHRHLSLREGGGGGGLEEYKLLEKTLKDFGSLEDDESDMINFGETKKPAGDDSSVSEIGSATVKDEVMDGIGAPAEVNNASSGSDRWIAINSVVAAAAAGKSPDAMSVSSEFHRNPSTTSDYQHYNPPQQQHHHHQQQQQHRYYSQSQPQPQGMSPNPPALISPSHSASTPSINSPFQRSEPSSTTYQSYGQSTAFPTSQSDQSARVRTYEPTMNSSGHPNESAVPSLHPPLLWSPEMKENWLNSLNTRLGGDDVAAFMDGVSCDEWNVSYPGNGANGSWLQTLWNGQSTGQM
ncbi:MAG: hypothetical protein M1837_001149 [Sclerophora amabilis]|nr:MAG: hypothetical protein M1837_001149 [Sclerophora amabilis]